MSLSLRIGILLIPLLVLASIWLAPLKHYYAPAPAPPDAVIETLRWAPSATLLREISEAKHALIPPLGRLIEAPAVEAEKLLAHGSDKSSGALFDPQRLGDLGYASMGVPRVLLKAYASTSDERYFDAARTFMADWAAFELAAWVPHGLLWNDHAIAARAWTFTEFWRLFRQHPAYNPDEASQFMRLVIAAAARLADPAHYTYASNHGTMQNLALMHLGLAFPVLAGFDALPDLGLRRQQEQYRYMMSPGGVVLEHSAGYHRLSMELLGIMLRYRTLQQSPIPEALRTAYARARSVYRQLRAADGTIPPLGDSSIALLGPEALTTSFDDEGRALPLRRDIDWGRPVSSSLYPQAGYAIWWSPGPKAPDANQTTITWAKFARHGHKHADELSFNLRSGDRYWWRSSGYWPLGHAQRAAAISWDGSNAPHLAGERANSQRQASLHAYAAEQGIFFVDLRREGPDEFRVRRQIIHVQPDLWLTLDSYPNATEQPRQTLWTTNRDIRISRSAGGSTFDLEAEGSTSGMQAWFLGDPAVSPRQIRGQVEPFSGWVEVAFSAETADSLLLEMPGNQRWVANVSLLNDPATADANAPVQQSWRAPDAWQFDIPTSDGLISVIREGQQLRVLRQGREAVLSLTSYGPASWRQVSEQAYLQAARDYGPAFDARLPYRTKMTRWLAALFVLQLLGMAVLSRLFALPWIAMGALASVGWLAIAVWLHWVYFAT